MNFTKAKTYLDKINLLYQGIQDDDQLSPIERKLMLDYISKLYDCFWSDEQQHSVFAAPVQKQNSIAAPAPIPTPTPPPSPAPEAVEVPVAQPYVAPEPVVEAPVEKRKPKKFDLKLPTDKVTATTGFNAAFNELFEQKATMDLSQKLSERPISNLKLAWGVGDKFLIINELFGKNNTAFEETIATLDGLGSMDAARNYLEKNIIDKHNWADQNKTSVAKNFIKTVRRRYL